MNAVAVRSWPKYLLDLPEDLRTCVSEEAEMLSLSLAETIRRVLCARYRMKCDPVWPAPGQDGFTGPMENRRFVLRVHPKLFAAIKRAAARKEITMKEEILRALNDHYERLAA